MKGLQSNWPGHRLFRGLDKGFIDLLARTAVEESYEPRDMVFREGEAADKFYLICSGSVSIAVVSNERGRVSIETLGADEVLGWSWLVEPYTWHFDAQANEPTKLIAFDASRVREYLQTHRGEGLEVLNRFIPIIVERLQATRLQLLDVYHVRT